MDAFLKHEELKSATEAPVARVESHLTKVRNRFSVAAKNRRVLRWLRRSSDLHYLDVGAGNGLTISDALQIGFETAQGVEISPIWKEQASLVSSYYERKQSPVHFEDFLAFDSQQKFDLITFFDFFEHVRDPGKAIDRAFNLLRPQGRLYIYQGNFRGAEVVRSEPHYRVPGLSLLGRQDAIEVLAELGKIASADDYSVENWIELGFFSSSPNYDSYVNSSGWNFRGDRPHSGRRFNLRWLKGMTEDPRVFQGPGLEKMTENLREHLVNAIRERLLFLTSVTSELNMEVPDVQQDYGFWEVLLEGRSENGLKPPGFTKLV